MNYVVSDTDLISIANAIRAKTGKTGALVFPSWFTGEIYNSIISTNDLYLTTITETATGNFTFTTRTVKQSTPYTFGETMLVATKMPLKSKTGAKNTSLITVGTPTAPDLIVSGGEIKLVGSIPTYAFTGEYIPIQVKAVWKSGTPTMTGGNITVSIPVTYTIPR